jgi:hypothetical protein
MNFIPQKDKEYIWTLYRQTLRQMLFLKSYIPNALLDPLIQYRYKLLPQKFLEIAKIKAQQRKISNPSKDLISRKVQYNYKHMSIDNISPKWIKIINMQFYRGICKFCLQFGIKTKTNPEHARKHIFHKFNVDIHKLITSLYVSLTPDTLKYEKILYDYYMTVRE